MYISEQVCDEILRDTYIAAPCNVGWENMNGDDRVRACGQCQQNVYNTSRLTKQELASLIVEKEGRVCLRLYRRKDGTVMTENCPVGLRRIRDAVKLCAIGILLGMAWIGLIGEAHAQGLIGAPIDGGISRDAPPTEQWQSFTETRNIQTGATALGAAVAGFWLIKRAKSHRNSVLLIAAVLGLIFAVIGFTYGMLEPATSFLQPKCSGTLDLVLDTH